MAFDDFRHYVSMHSLCDAIQRGEDLNGKNKIYIKGVKEFFSDVTKALDSMMNPPEGGGHFFMEPSLKKIIGIYGKDTSNISGGELAEMRQDLGSVLAKLENLETAESNFYKSKDAEFTFNFLKKFLPRQGGFSEYSKRQTNSDLEDDN